METNHAININYFWHRVFVNNNKLLISIQKTNSLMNPYFHHRKYKILQSDPIMSSTQFTCYHIYLRYILKLPSDKNRYPRSYTNSRFFQTENSVCIAPSPVHPVGLNILHLIITTILGIENRSLRFLLCDFLQSCDCMYCRRFKLNLYKTIP
jgi:hypothetical protein